MDGFVDYIDRNQGIDPAWRDSVLALHPGADAAPSPPGGAASRRCARCRARGPSARWRSSSASTVPALVVASHDDADPGHPYAVAAAYARALPRAQADQRGGGGVAARLAGRQALARVSRLLHRGFIFVAMKVPSEATLRRIIAFVAALGIGVATYITIADSGGGAPACLAGGRRLRDGRQQLLLAHRRGQHRDLRDRRLRGPAGDRLLRQRPGSLRRLRGRARRLRLQHLPDLHGDLQDRSDLPVVRGQRRADDDSLPAQCHAPDRLRGDHRRRGARSGLAATDTGRTDEQQAGAGEAREERLQEESRSTRRAPHATAPARRRRRLPGDRRGRGTDRRQLERRATAATPRTSRTSAQVDRLLGGIPQKGLVLGDPKARSN